MSKRRKGGDPGFTSEDLKRIWGFFRPLFKTFGGRIWLLLGATFVLSLYGIGLKRVEGWAFDLLTNPEGDIFYILLWISVGIAVVQGIKCALAHLINYDLSARLGWLLREFKNTICNKVERAVPEIFLVLTVESVRGRIKEVSDIRDFIRRIPFYLVRLVTGILAAIFAAMVHPAFLILIAIDFVLAYLKMKKYIPTEMKLDMRHKSWNDDCNQAVKDSFDRAEEVHTSGAFDAVKERIEATSKMSQKSRNLEVWANTIFGIKMDVQTSLVKGIYYLIGFYQVVYGGMTIGELYTLFMFRSYIDDMENSILEFIGYELPQMAVTVKRVEEVLNLGERQYGRVYIPAKDVKTLEVKDLTYGYSKKDKDGKELEKKTVLNGISCTMNMGESIAIVGGSGSGKTTFIRCLLGLRTGWGGEILLNGVSIKDLSEDCLPGIFSLVSARNTPLTGTILDQFLATVSRDKFDYEFMRECCRIAGCLEFIESLPKGFNTDISEKGQKLSDGEKQRVCLAVSLMQKAVILVMDEATSALDPETQLKVFDNLKKSMWFKDRMIINIAHRLAITTNADRIYVMGDDGKFAGVGTHQQLMETCPKYQKLVHDEIGKLLESF